jgi:predicted lipoprotein with Yx(FWY)xxD motif
MLRFAPLTLCALLFIGCGGGDDGGSAASTPPEKAAKPAKQQLKKQPRPRTGVKVKVVSSQYGKVLADRRGQAFYLFGKEKSRRARCYGACATAWPPVITRGDPRAGPGARQRLLGTTRRRDGRLQLTYAGQPMYYYESDAPGRILCQNVTEFGGPWLVVRPNGRAVS